jgi:hypothetical protein
MTDKPDFYVEPQGDHIVLVANKRARAVLNQGFEKPRPRWLSMEGRSEFLTSPEYRCIVISSAGHGLATAMLYVTYKAGLSTMFKCTKCAKLHIVDDKQAEHLLARTMETADGVLPAHGTIQ